MIVIDLHVEKFSSADKEFVLQYRIEFDPSGLHCLIGDCVDMGDGAFGGFEMTLLLDSPRF